MDIEYIKENYRFETLTPNHNLSNFKCASEDLNNFLKDDALTQQKSKLNLTKLVMCDDVIVGYVSLLTDTIPLKDIRDEDTKQDIKDQLDITSKKRKFFFYYITDECAASNVYHANNLDSPYPQRYNECIKRKE